MKPYHWKKKRLLVEPLRSYTNKMSTTSLPSLTCSNLRKIDDPLPVIAPVPELEMLSDSSGRSTASMGSSGQNSPRNSECQRGHCQSLELQLEATTVENMILKEDNLKLKERLDKVEEELRNKDKQVEGLTAVKEAVKKLYSVGEAVLAAMDGSDVIEERAYDKVEDIILVDRLCSDLQDKLLEWQGNHQRLHDNLDEVVRATNSLAEQLLGRSAPVGMNGVGVTEQEQPAMATPSLSSSTSGSPSSSRRNPPRRCRQSMRPSSHSACRLHQAVASQFACDHCGGTFCQLRHVAEKLDFVKNLNLVPRDSSGETPPTAGGSTPPAEVMEQDPQSSTGVKIEAKTEGPSSRPPIVMVDSTGQEHRFAGSYKAILPQEQVKSILDGTAPLKQQRFFCKCGCHYPNYSSLFHHIKFIGRSSSFKCGLCQEGFEIRTGMKAHLRITHNVDYCQGRFACLECGEDYSTVKEVAGHQRLVHENNDGEEGNMDEDEAIDVVK